MIVRCFVVSMMTAASGSAWAQSAPAPPNPPEQLLAAAVSAQTPAPAAPRPAPVAPRPPADPRGEQAPAPSPAPPAPPAPRREGLAVNVRVEVTITDMKPNVAPVTKTVTVVAGDGLRGSIRSEGSALGTRSTPLNVDVESTILTGNKIRLGLSLQYACTRAV